MQSQQTNRSRKNYSLWLSAWKRLKKSRMAMFGLVLFIIICLGAIFADVIAPYPFDFQNLDETFQFPNAKHWFGTDSVGRDIFSRILYGGRISLQIGLVSVLISVTIGGSLGAIAGFYGGKTDNLIMRTLDILLAIPAILLAITIVTALGPGMFNLMLAIGVSSIPSFARIVRASILSVKEQEFVEAARLSGCNDAHIIFSHLVPNIMAPIIVQVTLSMALAILSASSLSFIGLGIQPPMPEGGAMLSAGRAYIRNYSHIVLFPGLAIMATILSLNLLGDGLRDALDPRLKN